MQKVIIETPFKASVGRTEQDNRDYLELCIKDSLSRGESPYASHKMLTDALDDSDPEQRELGIQAGFAWKAAHDVYTVFYIDYGLSTGMEQARDYCLSHGMPFKTRQILLDD